MPIYGNLIGGQSNGTDVYVQASEPANASIGALWVDTDESVEENIDATLTKSGFAADAYVTGARIDAITPSSIGAKVSGDVESIETGGTGATTAAAARDNLGITRLYTSMVPYGTGIPSNADLNTTTYLKVGNYYCSANTTVATLTNCPTDKAFMMQVYSPLITTIDNETTGTYVYRVRKILTYNGYEYIQAVNSDGTAGNFTYGTWILNITALGGTMTGLLTNTANYIRDTTNGTEGQYIIKNDGTGTYAHNCKIYGGNPNSATAFGMYDTQNNRRILTYVDTENKIWFGNTGTSCILGGGGMYGTSLPSTGSTGQIFFVY